MLSELIANPELSGFDRVVEASKLPRKTRRDDRDVDRGYVVIAAGQAGVLAAFWTALEPAYVAGRALRMSVNYSAWEIRSAALELTSEPGSTVTTRTLHLGPRIEQLEDTKERAVLQRFARRTTPTSSYWLG